MLKRYLKDFISSLTSRLSINDEKFWLFIFDVIVLMGNCLYAIHHRNAISFLFFKEVSKVEGGLVAMDI